MWATLPLMEGKPVPVQRVLKLPAKQTFGPIRHPENFKETRNKLDALEWDLSMECTKAQLQREINQCYECWRGPAVEEALRAGDIDPNEISAGLKATAGGKIAYRWADPREALKTGRTAKPTWAGAALWLERKLANISKLMVVLECNIPFLYSKSEEELNKFSRQSQALGEHLRSMAKTKRENTPFPVADDSKGKLDTLLDRAKEACQDVLYIWENHRWLLGLNLWHNIKVLQNEATAHGKKNRAKKRNIGKRNRKSGKILQSKKGHA